jgi:Ca-activated chloride channel homolog
MRSATAVGLMGMLALAGCTNAQATRTAVAPLAQEKPPTAPLAVASPSAPEGSWVGAAADSDVLLARGGDAFMGVWVDIPEGARATVRAPVDLALVIDTSGSMEGAKIEAARASARTIVQRLADGDILSVDTFSDRARPLVHPVVLTGATREAVLAAISRIGTEGSTNIFDGLELAEMHVARAPQDHPVRRIVMISDGKANVGPSTPQALGDLAQRSLSIGAQVTSLGVGLDYDEQTLDAIAERTSGRLFHVGDPREMTATLEHEIDLLSATVADQASIEIVPAAGVVLEGVEGARVESGPNGSLHVPLGTLFAGQHRELLVRVRLTESASGTQRALASVRLNFHDPSENDVERVQETLARISTSDDPAAVASHANAKTHAMMAMVTAAKTEIQAAQDVGSGNFVQAQTQLATAEKGLRDEAARTTDDAAKKKLTVAAQTVAVARARAAAAPAAPPSQRRSDALEMNSAGMKGMGY